MRGPDHSVSPPADEPVPPDAALLERYVKGADQQAFAELVRRHSGWVFSIAQRRSGKVELAQECAQNVFAAMARKAPRLGVLPSLPAWLHRATMLECAALLRRDFRYEKAMKQHGEEIARQAAAGVPDVWQALRDEVDEALNSLSGADRDLLIQHHVEGRTFPEIAKDLGATEAAAQRRGHRALEKLAARLRRCGIALPAAAVGVALTSGMKAEASQAEPMVAGILKVIGESGVGAATSTGGGVVFPAWVVSPAMLAAIVIVSAGVPVWWDTGGTQVEVPLLEAGTKAAPDTASEVAGMTNPSSPAALTPEDQSLQFLRQALEQLGKRPSTGEPTRLGLQLRKYMLNLTVEELEPVGKLLGEVPGYKGEVPAIVGAFSTRLAQLNPPLALTLLADSADKGEGKNGGIRFSRTAFLDVLTRGESLAEVLLIYNDIKLARKDLIKVWASHQPIAAMEYAERSVDPAKLYSPERYAYLESWLRFAPADLAKWLDGNAELKPAIYDMALAFTNRNLGRWVIRQMPANEAVELTVSLKDPLLRKEFVAAMFYDCVVEQPEILAALAPFMPLHENGQSVSVGAFLNAWWEKDRSAADAWIQTLPDGELKTAAMRTKAETPAPTR